MNRNIVFKEYKPDRANWNTFEVTPGRNVFM